VCDEILAESKTLQVLGKPLERRKMEPPLRILHIRVSKLQQIELLTLVVIAGTTAQGRDRITAGDFPEQWENLMTQSVSNSNGSGVRRVLAPIQFPVSQPLPQILTANRQQGPDNPQIDP